MQTQANPADVYMDIIAGLVQPCNQGLGYSSGFSSGSSQHGSATLAANWQIHAFNSPDLQPPPEVEVELAAADDSAAFDRCAARSPCFCN